MSNRRTKSQRRKFFRAPREDAGVSDDQPDQPTFRSLGDWVLLVLKIGVGLGLLLGGVGALSYFALRYAQTTPRFAITQFEVEGTSRLLRQDVLRTAGLAKGQNIFSVEPEETSKKLLESPWISSVRVSRKLPGTVRLEIGERKPQAIALVGSQNYLVSEDGVPFKRLGQGDPHDFPLITGISLEALAKDRRAELARIVDALSLLRDYEHLSVFKKYPAQELHLESSGNAVLTVGGEGVSLHLGQAPWKQKLLRAEKVLSATRRAGGKANVVFLDNVAHPERVVVRVH